jgi:hypothetical protein
VANAAHTQDLLKKALSDVGEVPDGSSDLAGMALAAMNSHYISFLDGSNEFSVECGDPFIWARNRTPKSIVLQPIYETGTIQLTNGSTSGVFSTAPSSALGSFVNRYIKVTDRSSFYLITAHTAGATAFTLERAYIEATGSALAYKAIPAIYDLGSGILRLVEPLRCYGQFTSAEYYDSDSHKDGKIWGMGLNEFRRDYPLHTIPTGVPSRFATMRNSETDWLIEVNACPQEATKVDLDYVEIPDGLTDSSESVPIIPRGFRKVLSYATSFTLAVHKGQDKLVKLNYDLAKATLQAMVKAENRNTTHTGKNKGRILPRQEQLSSRNRNGYV